MASAAALEGEIAAIAVDTHLNLIIAPLHELRLKAEVLHRRRKQPVTAGEDDAGAVMGAFEQRLVFRLLQRRGADDAGDKI